MDKLLYEGGRTPKWKTTFFILMILFCGCYSRGAFSPTKITLPWSKPATSAPLRTGIPIALSLACPPWKLFRPPRQRPPLELRLVGKVQRDQARHFLRP